MKKLLCCCVLLLLCTACSISEIKQPVEKQILNEPLSETEQEKLTYTILAPAKDEICYEFEFCTIRWETNDTRTIMAEFERDNKYNDSYSGPLGNNELQWFIDEYFFKRQSKEITEERVRVVLVDLKTRTPLAKSDHTFIVRRAKPYPSGNYFVIMGSFTDKKIANNKARLGGYWVLPTDLTEKLSPGYYALVQGPYKNRADAQYVRNNSGYRDVAMVKDAGIIRFPYTIPASDDIPPAVAAAFAGRIDEGAASGVTFKKERSESGGNYCQHLGASTKYTAMVDDKPLKELVLKTLGPGQVIQAGESAYVEIEMYFWVSDDSTAIVGPSSCWD